MYAVFALYPFLTPSSAGVMPLSTLISAALLTLVRLAIAYFFAVVVAIPLALLVVSNSTIEALLLPVFDILESVPILAIFPIVVLFFIQIDFLEGAAFFILFLNMLWNIVFALVGGLKVIPKDITYAARIFGVRGLSYVERVLLPAAFPQFVTGSILAVAEGWNLIIVAEALHTYVPAGTSAQDLFGIGSILVSAAAHAEQGLFLTAVLVMVTLIALINFFVWQKLLHYAQRFRFD
jgi:NitT/TauT family transport system permease protein